MSEFFIQYEASLRLGFFLGTLLIMALWEFIAPRRPRPLPRASRWFNNLGMVALNTVMVRALVPILPVGFAVWCQSRGWGLLNFIDAPAGLEFFIAVVLLDGVIYWQHVMVHAIPMLWRLHRVHHVDLDLDVTSGNRFHPLEILLSIAVKLAAVAVLGPAPAAVLIFEVILNGWAQFNHSNVYIPERVDRWLRWLLVTPDMHRIHHSTLVDETNSNYGFNLAIWDRLFGSYRAQPALGVQGMEIGVAAFRDPAQLTLPKLLVLPFK